MEKYLREVTISENEKTRNARITMDKGQINPDKNIIIFGASLNFSINCDIWVTCLQTPHIDVAVYVLESTFLLLVCSFLTFKNKLFSHRPRGTYKFVSQTESL